MNSNKLLVLGPFSTFIFIASCTAVQIAQDVQQGRNALHIGHPAAAVSYLRRAADLDPNYHAPDVLGEAVLTYLGRAEYESGNFSEAQTVLAKALAVNQQDHTALLYSGLTQLRNGDRARGRRDVESGLKGIHARLESLASSPYRGIYWDPGREIRSEIQRALGGKLESAELVSMAEWVGRKVEDEVNIARRDELRDRYLRRGD
ncbi:MAG TPA: tetratricopeptide repeat protein [Candidatus Binatia bacterium]|nr:tetratricopeptide repeat protein [Candidatus Binatia bacterium]